MSQFKEIELNQLLLSPFDLKDKWMLITAEKNGIVNTMTASWGGFGIFWNKEVVFVVIRPQRYTKEFVDDAASFSLSFFDKSYKKQLSYLGAVSGRTENKIEKAALSVEFIDDIPAFKEAETVLLAKKLYAQPMGGEFFIEKEIIDTWYPKQDFHVIYFAEISRVLSK